MLIRLHNQIENTAPARLWWEVDGHETLTPGAVAKGAKLSLCLSLSRAWGAAAVVCRIAPDGGEYKDIPLTFSKTQRGRDFYTLVLDTAQMCGEKESGLFYYELSTINYQLSILN